MFFSFSSSTVDRRFSIDDSAFADGAIAGLTLTAESDCTMPFALRSSIVGCRASIWLIESRRIFLCSVCFASATTPPSCKMPLSLSSSNDGRLSRLRAIRSAVRCRSSLCLTPARAGLTPALGEAFSRPRSWSSSIVGRF